jgi:hypothetical protein
VRKGILGEGKLRTVVREKKSKKERSNAYEKQLKLIENVT